MFNYECGKCKKTIGVFSPNAIVECCGYNMALLGEEVRVKQRRTKKNGAKRKVRTSERVFIQAELFGAI